MTTWLICGLIIVVLGALTWFFAAAREASREMPPYPQPDRPWQPDPSRFGRCPSCRSIQPIYDGLVAAHDRPEPQVPFNVQSFPCRGAGQAPMQAMETER
jgi:hypothetical protein